MDKISSILSGSPRVKSVDISEAPPVRPGAPSNGRPEGRNSLKDRITLSERAKDLALQDTLAIKNPKETARAKMVDEVSKNFFNTRLAPVADEETQPASERALNRTPDLVKLKESEEVKESGLDIEA